MYAVMEASCVHPGSQDLKKIIITGRSFVHQKVEAAPVLKNFPKHTQEVSDKPEPLL